MGHLNVKIQQLSETAIMPSYGSTQAAGLDLYADVYGTYNSEGALMPPHLTRKIGCGFAFQPPEGYCGLIFARSGLATKEGLRPANCVGLCDEDYRGEYIVPLHNDSDEVSVIHHGDRIAQLVFVPYEQANLIPVDSLEDTARGDGGFGSTGA